MSAHNKKIFAGHNNILQLSYNFYLVLFFSLKYIIFLLEKCKSQLSEDNTYTAFISVSQSRPRWRDESTVNVLVISPFQDFFSSFFWDFFFGSILRQEICFMYVTLLSVLHVCCVCISNFYHRVEKICLLFLLNLVSFYIPSTTCTNIDIILYEQGDIR